jgi:hypothetical protein
VAIALWTFAALWGWVLSLSTGLRLYLYLQQRYRWKLPSESSAAAILVGLFGVGTIVFTISVLILGMRGRLPGTSRRDHRPQGFPIIPGSASGQP